VSFLLDTNIISEIRKADRADPRVSEWYASVADDELFLSVLVLGEIRQGIERAKSRDPRKAAALERWLNQVQEAFGPRILAVTLSIAEEWGKMNSVRSLPTVDSLLAATAKVHGLTLVTRNVADIAGSGAECMNPFERQA
jgi:predicted nucleic acid-binding protein